jgi:hypothetical protein
MPDLNRRKPMKCEFIFRLEQFPWRREAGFFELFTYLGEEQEFRVGKLPVKARDAFIQGSLARHLSVMDVIKGECGVGWNASTHLGDRP